MDERFMRIALEEAQEALILDEVPVGAVLVKSGKVITRAHNLCEASDDCTAHAELLCIREGSKLLGGRLLGCTLYTTLEPCLMCAGAIINARLSRVVFGAFDPLAGCCGSVVDVLDGWFTQNIEAIGGIMELECAQLLRRFFQDKRNS